ncbi:BPSL0067 family protein, partial [Escherichia coli]
EKHQLRSKGGANSDGSYPSASSNAEAFYVIE